VQPLGIQWLGTLWWAARLKPGPYWSRKWALIQQVLVTFSVKEARIRSILLDIEGTTTSVDFVYQTLFPYARRHLAEFVERHYGTAELRSIVEQLRREWEARLALADDIRAIAPPAERVAAFWPGAFSYFSGRDVIPLDGVIGSQAYFESHLKAGREFGYLEERRAAYLALFLPIPPEQLRSLERSQVIRSWADLGTRRLWEQRGVSWKSVSERPFTRRGGGWFLIELPWRCCG